MSVRGARSATAGQSFEGACAEKIFSISQHAVDYAPCSVRARSAAAARCRPAKRRHAPMCLRLPPASRLQMLQRSAAAQPQSTAAAVCPAQHNSRQLLLRVHRLNGMSAHTLRHPPARPRRTAAAGLPAQQLQTAGCIRNAKIRILVVCPTTSTYAIESCCWHDIANGSMRIIRRC